MNRYASSPPTPTRPRTATPPSRPPTTSYYKRPNRKHNTYDRFEDAASSMVIGPMMTPTRTRRALPTRPEEDPMLCTTSTTNTGKNKISPPSTKLMKLETPPNNMSADPASWAVEEYDQVHSADVDASKRFQELRLPRGFLPVAVALPEGQPAVASGHSKAQGRGKRPAASKRKPSQAKSRAASATQCKGCGGSGHWASTCPPPQAASFRSTPNPNKRPAIEDGSAMMARPERPDAVMLMLDPGALSFLAGYQLACVSHLEFIGYPIDQIQFSRCAKDLWFGGDHSAHGWSASPSS